MPQRALRLWVSIKLCRSKLKAKYFEIKQALVFQISAGSYSTRTVIVPEYVRNWWKQRFICINTKFSCTVLANMRIAHLEKLSMFPMQLL